MAIYTRGEEASITVGFFEDFGETVPRPPIDGDQPSYTILSPSGEIIATGAANAVEESPGRYRVVWSVPEDAELSRTSEKYECSFIFIDVSGNTSQLDIEFEVGPREVVRDTEKDKGYVVYRGRGATITNRRKREPFSISVAVYAGGNVDRPVGTVRSVLDMTPERLRDGDTWVYRDSVDKDMLEADTTYVVLWEIQETETSIPVIETELIQVLDMTWVPYFHAFDAMVNKVRARATAMQSWSLYEKFECLKQGFNMVNGWHPNNVTWTMTTFPHSVLGPYVLFGAQMWAMNMLYQAEGLTQFSFGGQSVTLDYDHTGWVDATYSRAMDYINSNLTRDKTGVMRRASKTAIVTGRPMSGQWRDRVIVPMTSNLSANGSSLLQMVSALGLL